MPTAPRQKFTRRLVAAIAVLGCVAAFVLPHAVAPVAAQEAVGDPGDCVMPTDCPAGDAVFVPSKSCVNDQEGFCFAKPPSVDLSVAIGGLRHISDIGHWVQVVYQFAIGIAAVLAAVMMMIAGLKWLTAAGDAGRVKAARGDIEDALIGLILALGAYVILQTVNPDILQLRTPSVKYVPKVVVTKLSDSPELFKKCDANNGDKDCPAGMKCFQPDDSFVETMAKGVGALAAVGAVGTAAVTIGGVSSFASAVNFGGKTLKAVFWPVKKAFTICWTVSKDVKAAFVCGAGVAYAEAAGAKAIYDEITKSGRCLPPASNLPKGTMCYTDGDKWPDPCAQGLKCIMSQNSTFGWTGFCGDGSAGSICRCSGTMNDGSDSCASPDCSGKGAALCVKWSTLGGGIWSCTDLKQGSNCARSEIGHPCLFGSVCSDNNGVATCTSPTEGTEGDSCVTDADCQRGRVNQGEDMFSCIGPTQGQATEATPRFCHIFSPRRGEPGTGCYEDDQCEPPFVCVDPATAAQIPFASQGMIKGFCGTR